MHHARKPSSKEFEKTKVMKLTIKHASMKSHGGPNEFKGDLSEHHWAGIIPIETCFKQPISDQQNPPDVPCPQYIKNYHRPN